MNQETIERHIKGLGKTNFDNVIQLLLEKVFSLKAIDVDGKGDGGSDYRIFSDQNGNSTLAFQKTVQDVSWQDKALADARKAVCELNAKRYFFLTSLAHEARKLRALESKISSELLIPATCLGATEISGLIVEQKLLGEFAYAINLPLDIDLRHRIDNREMLLHSYFVMSDDRTNFQSQIFENVILGIIHSSESPLTRDQLAEQALEQLGLSTAKLSLIEGRIDALFLSGKIVKKVNHISLSQDMDQDMRISDGIYDTEFSSLSSIQADLVSEYGGTWDQSQSKKALLLLARCFVEEQIKNAKNASLSFTMTGFGSNIMDSIDALRELINSSGVPHSKLDEIISKFIALAGEHDLIKKMTAPIIYIALEESVDSKASIPLGKTSWNEVKIIIDASVAIPYLVSSLFSPSKGRFSVGSNESLLLFKRKGARLRIPWVYLNECASHLLRAGDYCNNMEEFEDDLMHSQNGYVSHYYQLKKSGKNIPDTLSGYLLEISDSIFRPGQDTGYAIRSIMSDIQPIFNSYEIEYEDIPRGLNSYKRDIEIDYAHELVRKSRTKSPNLIQHDVIVLSHMAREYSENHNTCVCLTWDGLMINIGKRQRKIGWVVSPVEASDLFQSKTKLSESRLLSLANTITRHMERPNDLAAHILDHVVHLASEQFEDWEFRRKIKEYQSQAIRRLQSSGNEFDLDEFDNETNNYLRSIGVNVQNDTDENVEQDK